MTWDPTLASHIINPESGGGPVQSMADTDVGITVTIANGTSKEIVPAAPNGRFVTIYNRGNIPVSLSSLAQGYPLGKRLGVGETIRFFVRQSVWANAIPSDDSSSLNPYVFIDLIFENINAPSN